MPPNPNPLDYRSPSTAKWRPPPWLNAHPVLQILMGAGLGAAIVLVCTRLDSYGMAVRLRGWNGELAWAIVLAALCTVYRVHRYWHWRWLIVGAVGLPSLVGIVEAFYVLAMLGKLAGSMGS